MLEGKAGAAENSGNNKVNRSQLRPNTSERRDLKISPEVKPTDSKETTETLADS
jgi:hypothetical protein